MPDQPMSESPPIQGVPGLGNIGNLQNEQQKIVQAMQQYLQWQRQNQQMAGPAGAARPGMPAQSPQAPYGQLPGGVPGQQQQPRSIIQQAAAGGGAGVPVGTAPQIQPAMQAPYYGGGARGGTAANAIIGVGNLIARQRQQDQQKEATQAEGLWTQILTAQQNIASAAAQGQDDPYDKKLIQTILENDKNRKMIQDTLGTLTTVPGQQQQQNQDPKAQAQSSGMRAALQKLESGAKRALSGFDPRTAAQKMPAGGTTPMNTPGGAMWNFPGGPTRVDIDRALLREDPASADKIARMKEGLDPKADVAARLEWEKLRQQAIDKYRADLLAETKRRDDLMFKAREDAIKASAAKNNVPEVRLKSLYDKFRSGDMDEKDLSRLPPAERKAVLDFNIPIARELNQQQRTTLSAAKTSEELINQMQKSLDKMRQAKPELFEPGFLANLKATGKTYGLFQLYSNTGLKIDPIWTEFFAGAGATEAKGAAPFMTVARNRQMLDIALQHLPKPTDSPQQLQTKIDWLRDSMVRLAINDINDYRWNGHPVPDPYTVPGQAPSADPAWQKYGEAVQGDPSPPPEYEQ